MQTAGETLDAVRGHLLTYGLELTHERPEAMLDPAVSKGALRFEGCLQMVRILTVSPMTLTALAQAEAEDRYPSSTSLPILVVGRSVHEKSASAFREMGISFADSVGNAYIRFQSVLVDVRGRRPPPGPDRRAGPNATTSSTHSSNMFSTGRAQVIAALLTWPGLDRDPVREIAKCAGVSTGQAHSALTLLEQTGYLADRALRRDKVDELLDLWAAAYPGGLGRKLAVASYDSRNGLTVALEEILGSAPSSEAPDRFDLSGEAVPGIGVKQPLNLILYARDWTPRQAVRHRWRAAPSAAAADIHIRHRFWVDPYGGQLTDPDRPVAPWPIVYADLLAAGDPRLAEVAAHWRHRHRTS